MERLVQRHWTVKVLRPEPVLRARGDTVTTTASETCSTQYAGGSASAWEPVVCRVTSVNYLYQGASDGCIGRRTTRPRTLEDALGPLGSVGAAAATDGMAGLS